MTYIEQPSDPHQPEKSDETFCTYLGKLFIAKKGFELANIPELEKLHDVCEGVLTRSDGYSFEILCLVDREARPKAMFDLSADDVRDIGEACLKYAGKLRGTQMPVFVGILEVGPASSEQQQRLQQYKRASLTSKVVPFTMTIDTIPGHVWHSRDNWLFKGRYRTFVVKAIAAPREAGLDFKPPAITIAPPSFPILTSALLLALVAVFAAEIVFGIGPWTKLLQPTNATLAAFGGMMKNAVMQSGEWYRLLSAPFLHLDAGHLVINAIALFVAGRALEPLIGRAWFGAVYVVSALAGSVLSLALNPPFIIAVGASGAIMGLFAAMLAVSLHLPVGAMRASLQRKAIYVLIPSLLPLAGALKGQKVDYAAHGGGAIGGAVLGLVLVTVWSRTEAMPAFRQLAGAIAIAGVVALAYPATSVLQGYGAMTFLAQLIPADKLPKTGSDIRLHAAELIAQYPHDPRPRFFMAADLLDGKDSAGAEREARAGLADEESWRPLLAPQFGDSLRVVLALAIDKDRHEEALRTARSACDTFKDGPMRKLLDERKLCEM
jgi:rhomboid protease GluP